MARRNRREQGGRRDRFDDEQPWQRRREPPPRRTRDRRIASAWERQPITAIAPISLPPPDPPQARTCGRCHEWLADEVGGRGECLHPGSGILRPWWETPACTFFR